jgi:hypothetical protein
MADTKCYGFAAKGVQANLAGVGRRSGAKLAAHGDGLGTACARRAGDLVVFWFSFFFSLPGQFQVHVIGLCACVVHVDTCQSLEPGDRGI